MPTNYTSLTNGQFATAAVFNAPLTELDNAIQAIVTGSKTLTAPVITGGTINGATIGATTPSTGKFTTLQVGTPPTYGAPTGTPTRTTFATGSVTLPQLAERVKAIIDDLRTMQLFA